MELLVKFAKHGQDLPDELLGDLDKVYYWNVSRYALNSVTINNLW